MRYTVDGNYVEVQVNDDTYYCTGKDGRGLFFVDSAKNELKQIEGTAQFSVAGVEDKKGKLRRYLKERGI